MTGAGDRSHGDDGFGPAALEALRSGWELPDDVTIASAASWDMALTLMLQGAAAVVLLDAIDAGAPVGTSLVLERDVLPRYLAHKLALRDLQVLLPPRAVAIGVQPAPPHAGGLSPAVAAAIPPVVWRVAAQLAAWGYDVHPRAGAGGGEAAT